MQYTFFFILSYLIKICCDRESLNSEEFDVCEQFKWHNDTQKTMLQTKGIVYDSRIKAKN